MMILGNLDLLVDLGKIRNNHIRPAKLEEDLRRMGGPGSGRYAYSGRKTTDDLPSMDVRALRRGGDIAPGQEELIIRTLPAPTTVRILWEPSGFSGAHGGFPRPWFDCPGGCGRRVAILYLETRYTGDGANRLLCRTCLDLVYKSQRENRIRRAKRRMEKARARLVPPGEDLPSEKPLNMHHRTLVRLGREFLRARNEHVALYNEKAARQATALREQDSKLVEDMERERVRFDL